MAVAAGKALPARPSRRARRPLRICLAASGGGHIRQLLDLEGAWSAYDHFFVSEETALTRTIAEKHRTRFVTHFAFGQARLAGPLKLIGAALANFAESVRIIAAERPDVVVSTGAGTVFFTLLLARMTGARVVLIESFARISAPSKFGRMAAPLAHHRIVQSPVLAERTPGARLFDPLRLLDGPRPPKAAACLVTVGAILPFDRLVRMAAAAHSRGEIPERMLIQTGLGGARPAGIETVETLPFDAMQAKLAEADIVICHGGTGSLITALRQGCRVVAVPRLASEGEVYDDHQAEITKALAERGLIAVANTDAELTAALALARAREPVRATTDHEALGAWLSGLFGRLAGRNSGAPPPDHQTPRARRGIAQRSITPVLRRDELLSAAPSNREA